MEKKLILAIFGILLISLSLAASIPQFLFFEGSAKIDGRIANEKIINFSIQGTEIIHSLTNEEGKYSLGIIQGFDEFYGEQFNITINGYETQEKINYVYPQDIYLNLSALTEKALKILDYSPEVEEIVASSTGKINFNISTETDYPDFVNHSWFLDGEKILDISNVDFSNFGYQIDNNSKGTHKISFIAKDGFLSVVKEWSLIVARPDIKGFGGKTTDFSNLNLNDLEKVPNVILEKLTKGKIEFLGDLNLTGIIDLEDIIKIENGIVAIDATSYPQLNVPARITLRGLSYNTIPKIFYNGDFTTNPGSINQECDFCKMISYTKNPTNNGIVVFEVDHFSSFKVDESGERYNLTLFKDLDICEMGTQGDLILEIREPDKREKFELNEEIEIEIEVTNKGDEDKSIIVEVYLYNIDKDDVEKDFDEDRKKIKKGKKESFDLILKVPDDFEEDNYLIFVKAYEKGEEEIQCNQEIVEIELEREDYYIFMENLLVEPQITYPGNELKIQIDLQNRGAEETDVQLILKIEELNISIKSQEEEFGEKDSFSETFYVKIPEYTPKGEYNLSVEVIFEEGNFEERRTIFVSEKEIIPEETIFLESKELQKEIKPMYVPKIKKRLQLDWNISLLVPLGISIGILILLILLVLRKRKP